MTRPARRRIPLVAVALLAALCQPGVAEAAAPYDSIYNDEVWLDSAQNEIKAQGGSVLRVGSTYYWVGIEMNNGAYAFQAVNLYSSTDLENWTFRKRLFTPQASGDFKTGNWVGRPDLVYNPSTQKYVLVMEMDASDINGPGNYVGFASSSTVDGSYTYHGHTLVNGNTMGDHSVFVEGSNAYLVYVGDSATTRNVSLNIAPLASDWLSVRPAVFSQPDTSHEAPFLLKVGTTYHWFASGKNWWASTPASHRTGSSLTSWNAWSTLQTSPPSGDTFNTQFDFVVPVTGTGGTSYLYAGDRYTNFAGSGYPAAYGRGRNAWYPLRFNGSTPVLQGYTNVEVDLSQGRLTGNLIGNAHFDAAGPTQTPYLWQEWSNGNADAGYTESGGVDEQRLAHYKATAYQIYTYQSLTGLENGAYTLTASVKSSGGQTSALMTVKNHGSAEVSTSLATSMPTWTTVTLPVTVSNGKAEIAFWSDAPGGKWLNVDDVVLRKS